VCASVQANAGDYGITPDGSALELIQLPFTLQDSRFGSIASRPARGRGSVQIATSFDDVCTVVFRFYRQQCRSVTPQIKLSYYLN
jgi:hypothetical protein